MNPVTILHSLLFSLMVNLPPQSWYVYRITDTPGACAYPRVAVDADDYIHVAWVEEPGTVFHCIVRDGVLEPAEIVGEGDQLHVSACLSCNLLYFTWVGLDGRVHFEAWRSDVWYGEEVLPWGGFGAARHPRATKAGGAHVVWEELQEPYDGVKIFHAAKPISDWGDAEELAGPIETWLDGGTSVSINPTDAQGRLLVTWLEDAAPTPGLYGRVWNLSEWEAAALLFEGWGTAADSDHDPVSYLNHFASNSLQPTCPCNVVFYAFGTLGDWSAVEEIGTGHTGYYSEWPQQPAVRIGWDGAPHVVWRHESYDEGLQLADERLLYATRDPEWSFESLAIGRNARDPSVAAMITGVPVVVWRDDSSGNFEIYLAAPEPVLGVLDRYTPAFAVSAVRPNPARQSAVLAFQMPAEGRVLAHLFDVRGRMVRTLHDQHLSAGPHLLRLDLSAREGARIDPGIYFMKLDAAGERLSRKLIVLR